MPFTNLNKDLDNLGLSSGPTVPLFSQHHCLTCLPCLPFLSPSRNLFKLLLLSCQTNKCNKHYIIGVKIILNCRGLCCLPLIQEKIIEGIVRAVDRKKEK